MILQNIITDSKLHQKTLTDGWKTWFHKIPEEACLVVEKDKVATIDIRYLGNDKFQLQLFNRNDHTEEAKKKLKQIASECGIRKCDNTERYILSDLTDSTTYSKLLKQVLSIINKFEA